METLRFAVFCLSLFGFVVFLARRLSVPVVAIPFLVTNVTILCLYLAAICGILLQGAVVICASGLVLFAQSLFSLRRSASEDRHGSDAVRFAHLGVVLVPLLLIWVFSRQLTCYSWDEFTHWAYAVKDMWHLHALPARDTSLLYPNYTPGATLYRYYGCLVIGYSEANMYFAHLAMLYFAVLVFFQRVRWTPRLAALTGAFLGYFFLFVWRDSILHSPHIMHLSGWAAGGILVYALLRKQCKIADVANVLPVAALLYTASYLFLGSVNLYADSLLGIYLGAISADAVLARSSRKFRLYWAIPALGGLALVKDVGYIFAVFGSVVVLAPIVLGPLRTAGGLVWNRRWRMLLQDCRRRGATLWAAVAVLAIPHLCYGSWSWYVAHAGYPQGMSAGGLGAGVSQMVEAVRQGHDPFSAEQRIVVQEFCKGLFHIDVWQVRMASLGHASILLQKALSWLNQLVVATNGSAVKWSCWVWSLTLLSLGVGAAFLEPTRRRACSAVLTAGIWFSGFVFYLGFLLASYLYLFPAYMATTLPSFARYAAPFVCAWLLSVVARFIRDLYRPTTRVRAAGFLLVTMLLVFLITSFYAFHIQTQFSPRPERALIQDRANYTKTRVQPDSRVFIVWQHARGWQFFQTRYELYPLKTQRSGFSLCLPGTNDNDNFLCLNFRRVLTPSDWGRDLADFDYVLICSADAAFWRDYSDLFLGQSRAAEHFLFRVAQGSRGIELVPM